MCSFFVSLCLLSAKSRVAAKAKAILLKHFNEAISDKEGEIEKINEAIVEAQTSLHLLRYGCVSKTYAAFKASASSSVRTILFYKMHAPIERYFWDGYILYSQRRQTAYTCVAFSSIDNPKGP